MRVRSDRRQLPEVLVRVRAELAAGVGLELGAELPDDRAGRHRRRVGEDADRPADHRPGDLVDEVDLVLRPLPALEAAGPLRDPPGALAAGRALAAGLVGVEPEDVP